MSEHIDWGHINKSMEQINKRIAIEIPLKENPSVRRSIFIEDKYDKTKEVIILRGSIKDHQISVGTIGKNYIESRSMTLSLTMEIGKAEENFIITVSDFENFIHFNDRESYEIIVIDEFMRIKKIS